MFLHSNIRNAFRWKVIPKFNLDQIPITKIRRYSVMVARTHAEEYTMTQVQYAKHRGVI